MTIKKLVKKQAAQRAKMAKEHPQKEPEERRL